MRRIVGINTKLHPLTYDVCRGFSKKFAERVFFPLHDKYLYFVTEGLHGAEIGIDSRPIVEAGRCPNENGDLFLWSELLGDAPIPGQKVYETWRGRNLLENHDPKNIRGEIIDTYPIASRRSIDMLDALDRVQFPKLAKRIEEGEITDSSMGLITGWTECSVCGKKMKDIEDWCDCLRLYKARKHPSTGELVYETSHDLIGIEDSLITVGQGADVDSKIRELIANKKPLEFSVRKKYREYRNFCAEKKIPPQEFSEFLEYLHQTK